ncbi:hypothetical protein GGR54DRAFT_583126 [Hypoxylon sp. NC1633]|nr:hypothetical protein GGR54DRAFT_583126 [Hypoxylon sp. NC1633]
MDAIYQNLDPGLSLSIADRSDGCRKFAIQLRLALTGYYRRLFTNPTHVVTPSLLTGSDCPYMRDYLLANAPVFSAMRWPFRSATAVVLSISVFDFVETPRRLSNNTDSLLMSDGTSHASASYFISTSEWYHSSRVYVGTYIARYLYYYHTVVLCTLDVTDVTLTSCSPKHTSTHPLWEPIRELLTLNEIACRTNSSIVDKIVSNTEPIHVVGLQAKSQKDLGLGSDAIRRLEIVSRPII